MLVRNIWDFWPRGWKLKGRKLEGAEIRPNSTKIEMQMDEGGTQIPVKKLKICNKQYTMLMIHTCYIREGPAVHTSTTVSHVKFTMVPTINWTVKRHWEIATVEIHSDWPNPCANSKVIHINELFSPSLIMLLPFTFLIRIRLAEDGIRGMFLMGNWPLSKPRGMAKLGE